MSLQKPSVSEKFTHVYVEESIRSEDKTKEILSHFPHAVIIPISNVHEVFDRRRQSYAAQHAHQNLILARKEGSMLYKGAPVCQDFNEKYFYYTSLARNCIYDCEYCWLKGMYSSGNLVVFINQKEIMDETEKVLREHPLYVCLSYDTDLMALEPLIHVLKPWSAFLQQHPDLICEVRTKSADLHTIHSIQAQKNMILAWTMSPQAVIDRYEHLTPSLETRIKAVREAMECGFPVRLCFDPMIIVPQWQQHYRNMVEQIAAEIDLKKVRDFSVGTFRISKDYLMKMRKESPFSAAAWYPYQLDHGYYHYGEGLDAKMEEELIHLLSDYVPREKIFTWREL